MNYVVIPDLVSLKMPASLKLRSFHTSADLKFFAPSKRELPFHYKLDRLKAKPPIDYDFKHENYQLNGDKWSYQNKLAKGRVAFSYHRKDRHFSFNRLLERQPFRIGGMYSTGEYLSDIIGYELWLKNIWILRGLAVVEPKSNKTICLVTPGHNGKTTLLTQLLKAGYKYVAEDVLVIDADKGLVYPSCPFLKTSAWLKRASNQELKQEFSKSTLTSRPQKIDSLVFAQNNTSNAASTMLPPQDQLILNSMYFIGNPFIKAMLADDGMASTISPKTKLFIKKLKPKSVIVDSYNYLEVLRVL